jgi:hypothetical protein
MRMMKVYIYSLAIVVPRTFTQERNCDLDRELVHHDNLRTVADFAINPLPRPLSRRYQVCIILLLL